MHQGLSRLNAKTVSFEGWSLDLHELVGEDRFAYDVFDEGGNAPVVEGEGPGYRAHWRSLPALLVGPAWRRGGQRAPRQG